MRIQMLTQPVGIGRLAVPEPLGTRDGFAPLIDERFEGVDYVTVCRGGVAWNLSGGEARYFPETS